MYDDCKKKAGFILSAAKDLCISPAAPLVHPQKHGCSPTRHSAFGTGHFLALITAAVLAFALPASAQDLTSTLNRTTAQVTEFLDQVSNVRCTERVSQIKFNAKNTRAEIQQESNYDYLILLQGTGDDLLLNESRLEDKNDAPSKRNLPLLITNGFSTLFLIFHPYYRNSFRFDSLPDDFIEGQRYQRLLFTHIPGTRTPAALAVRGREYPLELTGSAWVEPSTGMIARIDIALANDMHDVGLRVLTAQVDYIPVQLPGWSHSYRFPSVATVEVESLRQHWRNVHRFTNYQRFMVDTQESVANNSGAASPSPGVPHPSSTGEGAKRKKKQERNKDAGASSLRSEGGSSSNATTNSDVTNQ